MTFPSSIGDEMENILTFMQPYLWDWRRGLREVKIEMEGWWDKETARLSALPDLHSEGEIQKQGNRGDRLNMSGIQREFVFLMEALNK